MPIETACPHCKTKYRLKDEFVGKSVTCRTDACRKTFVVMGQPVVAGSAPAKKQPAKPAAASPPPPPVDAEALAAELFSEEFETKKAEDKLMAVVCEICSHTWQEPSSKIGKIVLCPECKHRQKIPEPKKKTADWRDASGGRRLLEKGPELPKDLQEQTMQDVSIGALSEAGAIEAPEVEPRPLKDYLIFGGLVLAIIAGVTFGVLFLMKSKSDGNEAQMMAEAVKEIEAIKNDGPLPKGQAPLWRAHLHLARSEFELRTNSPAGLKASMRAISEARKELEALPPGFERDWLFAELPSRIVALGGTEEQAQEEVRLRWSQSTTKAPPVGASVVSFMQTELRQLMSAMLRAGVAYEWRAIAARRITRELTKAGQPGVLFEILKQGFEDYEMLDAEASVLLTAQLSGASEESIKRVAENYKQQLGQRGAKERKPAAVALFAQLNMTDVKVPINPPVPGAVVLSETRQAYALLSLAQGKLEDAKNIANGPGPVSERLDALAMLAEHTDQPKILAEAALALNPDIDVRKRTTLTLFRLAKASAEHGDIENATKIAESLTDDASRELALAMVARGKWIIGKATPSASELMKPDDIAKARVGHAVRHFNYARATGKGLKQADATDEYDRWKSGELRGFGYAGYALGLQDAK
jgi:hypothetical protein